jgi:O-antigen/teichoic acid export membrane protein
MGNATPDQFTPDAKRVMTIYAQTMTRTGGMYAVGLMGIVPFGIVSLAVTTRFLDPSDYGRLTVLFAISSVLTILSGIGYAHGAFLSAYGLVDGDGGDGGDDFDVSQAGTNGQEPPLASLERQRLLGSGLLIVIVTSTALCGLVPLVAGLGVHLIFGSNWTSALLWMGASAWAGSLWRFISQIPRMERRTGQWAMLQFIRPAIVVASTVAALVAGYGVNGVLMATAFGTLLTTALAFGLASSCFHFDPQIADIFTLWQKGRSWVPLIVAGAFNSNVNVFFLSTLAAAASVGIFGVATRVAMIPIYFADGFLTGWPVMEMSPISIAAKERKGNRSYSAKVFTLFFLSTLGLLLTVSLLSDALVQIAAPSYASAASLIPVVAAAFGAQAVFRGLYRATAFPKRRFWFTVLNLAWIAPYVGFVTLLVSWNPSYGVAIAQLAAGITVATLFVLVDSRGPDPTPFQWKRLGGALLAASGCVVAVHLVPTHGDIHAMLSVAALLVFPLLLLATRSVSLAELGTIRKIAAAAVPRRMSKTRIRTRLASVPTVEREAILQVACEQQTPQSVASKFDVTPAVVLARVVRGLRHFGGGGPSTPVDHLVGGYVLHGGTTIERDALAGQLRALGVDPLDLHFLDDAIRTVSRLARSNDDRFPSLARGSGSARAT